MSELELYVPKREELWYRQEIMSDPETMSYNKGYDLADPGYHRDTGCIDFPEERWDAWYDKWIAGDTGRFCAYLRRKEDGKFLGEVALYPRKNGEPGCEMGIVVKAEHRGKGYSAAGMELLLAYAFETLGAPCVWNEFEETRKAAMKLHLAMGFEKVGEAEGVTTLKLTRERYETTKGKEE